jgi:hypothetical protein
LRLVSRMLSNPEQGDTVTTNSELKNRTCGERREKLSNLSTAPRSGACTGLFIVRDQGSHYNVIIVLNHLPYQ